MTPTTLFSWRVSGRLGCEALGTAPHAPSPLAPLAGDLSYATVNPHSCSPNNTGCDEVEWTWDAFGMQVSWLTRPGCTVLDWILGSWDLPPHHQIEPFASTAPYVTAVGNHEHVPGNVSFPGGKGAPEWHAEFAAYSARYGVGGGGPSSAFWYSVEAGPLHLCVISSEHAYARGSPQWEWLTGDLAAVDRGVTPWLAVMLHRPVLSAAVLEWDNHCPGCPLSAALEPLFRNASVDVVIAGHIHRCAHSLFARASARAMAPCRLIHADVSHAATSTRTRSTTVPS